MISAVVRDVLGVALLAIVAWVIRWRRARPDLCPVWLAGKLCALLLSIAVAAFVGARGQGVAAVVSIGVADVAAVAIAVRLWMSRRWLLGPAEAALEARRLADAALDLTATVERGRRG